MCLRQSSGIDGNNLHDVEGIVTVRFLFHENYLAAGEYEISVYCANGCNCQAIIHTVRYLIGKSMAVSFLSSGSFLCWTLDK